MTQAAIETPIAGGLASWHVAIIDDVYAGATRNTVEDTLATFCAAVSQDEALVAEVLQHTKCDFSNPEEVSDESLHRLYQHRAICTKTADAISELFLSFDQRLQEVNTISDYLKAMGCKKPDTFASVDKLFSGKNYELVFLDLRLAGGERESQELAKEIYEKLQAFVLLMSNIPGAGDPEKAEDFRKATHLLRGLFDFCAKDKLCDAKWFRWRMDTLPRSPAVCRAVQEFVKSIDKALGGPLSEIVPNDDGEAVAATEPGVPLAEFMHTLRTLGLQDYALLCELTLRDEGHPLGDYMMRLLSTHLLARLMADVDVQASAARLDGLRFTEFLPFFGDPMSPAFNRMYADSLAEAVAQPWNAHPWSESPVLDTNKASPASAEGAATEEEPKPKRAISAAEELKVKNNRELVELFQLTDDEAELPFLQLGDLLIKDEDSLVYSVLSASCDLQFTPENVSKSRPRERSDTVLLLPGRMRRTPPFADARAATGLIRWNSTWYCVEWLEDKLLSIPHCTIRPLLQARGYKHERRLRMTHALELQHTVLAWISRIGLDVQPPFPKECSIALLGRNHDDTFGVLGEVLDGGALLFHGGGRAALVLRANTYQELISRMQRHAEATLPQLGANKKAAAAITAGQDAFQKQMIGMKRPILFPEASGVKSLRVMDSAKKDGTSISQLALRVGVYDEPLPQGQKEYGFCLSVQVND